MTGEPDGYTDDGTPIFKEDVPTSSFSWWWLLLLLLLFMKKGKQSK